MKKLLVSIAFLLVMGCSKSDNGNPVTDPTPKVYNPNGTWSYTGVSQTYQPGTCGFASNPIASVSGTFDVVQVGSVIGATTDTGIAYVGVWENNVATMTASYVNGAFAANDILTFGLSSDTAGSGLLEWALNDGLGHSCTGSVAVTGSKS